MPARWLSIRKRNPQLLSDQDSRSAGKQPDFDFAFEEQPSTTETALPRVGPRLVQIRPTTSGGSPGKRKLCIDVPSTRPQTSENRRPAPLQNINGLPKSETGFIGLAFGSPSHPPAQYYASPEDLDSTEQNPFPRQHQGIRDRNSQMNSKRWRKIGTLFKSRQGAVRRDEVPSGPTIGLPTGFVVLDKDPTVQTSGAEELISPTGQPDHPKREPPPPPIEKDQGPAARAKQLPIQKHADDQISRPSTDTATEAGSTGEPHTRPPLPKLELDIPRSLAAKRSSSLLARRSRTLESLKAFDDSRPTTKNTSKRTSQGDYDNSKNSSELLTPLMPPRRLTTPTTTRSPAVSKYSLFPATSLAPVKYIGRVPGSEHDNLSTGQLPGSEHDNLSTGQLPGSEHDNLSTGQLRRSATSPARLSPLQDQFSTVPKPSPLNPKRTDSNEQMASPEDNTASTDRSAPWSSAHSFKSSVSSATTVDEIFFDIKSFRDSQGVEDGQFVMTRPDSTQVELARTRSKKLAASSRLRQMGASTGDNTPERLTPVPPEPTPGSTGSRSTWTTNHTSVNTAYFDEAIAAVERLTTPTNDMTSIDRMPSIPSVTIANHDDQPQQQISFASLQPSKLSDHPLRFTSKSHEAVSRLIPSPVVEVREDDSPKPAFFPSRAPTPQASQQSQLAKVVSPRLATLKRVDRPIDDSPTIPQGPPSPKRSTKPIVSPSEDRPPPVPKKDAKFIPMSKFAPKGTVTAIEQRAGVTPTRPTRANTDDLPLRSSPLQGPKERSATLPSSLQSQPHASPQNSSLRGLEKVVPPRPNPVALNPVNKAEVAVARTVSLARKQSARVHVPGPRLTARRAEAQAQVSQSQSKTQAKHNRNASTASQKSNKSAKTSFLGHRHRRTTSSARSTSARRASKDLSSASKVTKSSADGKAGKFLWNKESEKQMIKEARKWEILEKKAYSPVVVQAARGHKPGVSVGLVVESI